MDIGFDVSIHSSSSGIHVRSTPRTVSVPDQNVPIPHTCTQSMLSRSSISVSRVPLVVSPRQVGVVSCPNSDLISAHLRIFAHQTPPMAMAIPWNGCIANVNIVRRRDGGKGMRTHNPGQPNPIPRGAMSKRRKCSATGRKKSTTMTGTLPN